MRKLVLAAALLCGVSAHAHANFICSSPAQIIGKVGTNPVVAINVSRNEATHVWYVWHKLADGTVIDRANQYTMVDNTDSDSFRWTGRLNKNSGLWMQGTILPRAGGHVLYVESLRDSVHGNKLVMHSEADCAPEEAAAAPTPAAPPPAPTTISYRPDVAGNNDVVPFTMSNGAILVKVSVPGHWAIMQVDAGVGTATIVTSLADKLIAEGQATEQAPQTFVMADGSKSTTRMVLVKSLTVGAHTITDVPMSVVPENATMLLGLPVLNTIGKFTVDSANKQLTFS